MITTLYFFFGLLIKSSQSLVVNNKTVVAYGGPGIWTTADQYNTGHWNRTYHEHEPQQIHISWSTVDTFTVQFSTMKQVDASKLYYWPIHRPHQRTTISTSNNWEFIDGGEAKNSQFMHTLKSNKLQPATTYQYKIATFISNKLQFQSNSFQLHTSKSNTFQFIATGDMGVVNAVSMPVFKQLAQKDKYDFVTILGDQGYDLADYNGTKGDEYMNFAQDFYAQIPTLTTAGNHEYQYNFSHYKNRFQLLPFQQSKSENPMLYSINYKSLHLVSFNTEVFFEGSSDEIEHSLNWLEQDLKRANKFRTKVPWIIVMGHRPLYCSILSNLDCNEYATSLRFGMDGKRGLETLLSKYKVDLYLCGHKHNYERTFPVKDNTLLTTSYQSPPSFFQIISGNAGNYEGPDQFDDSIMPSWLAHRYQGYGFSTIKISRTSMDILHYKVNIDGTLGAIQDHVIVTN